MAKKNKVIISDDLIKDLKKYTTEFSVGMATFVRDEMYKTAVSTIDLFYDDYNPVYYKRKFYNFKNNSFTKYYNNPHNKIIRGGIELTPNKLDDIYGVEKSYIFDLFYSGHHGNVEAFNHEISNVPHVMNPSPLEILLDKQKSLVKNIKRNKRRGIERAKQQSYSSIHT